MKRVVISSFISLVVLALIYVVYMLVQRYSIVTTSPKNAIPPGTLFFMESKNTRNVFKQLADESLLSPVINSDSSVNERLNLLDSLLSTNNEIKEILGENEIYISAHLTKARSIDYLYLTNVSSSWSNDNVAHFISKTFHTSSLATNRVYESVSVREIEISPGRHFSFAITKGVFIGSFTSFLIDESIRQLKSGVSITHSKAFTKISKPSGNDDASLFINYISLGEWFSSYSTNGNAGVYQFISSFARWSRLDAAIQNNGLVLHGHTASTDTSDYLAALRWQQPKKIGMAEIFPLRTAMFIHLGIGDYPKYYRHLVTNSIYFDSPDKRTPIIRALEKKFQVELEQNLTGWIQDELALVVTEPGSPSFENSSYLCIKANNIERALESLSVVQNAMDARQPVSQNTEYRNHMVAHINLSGLVPLVYGNLFNKINNFFYTAIGSYVVIANQPSAIRSFIDDYEDNKILTTDGAYKKLMRSLSPVSNFFLYVNLDRSKNIIRHYALDDFIFSQNQSNKDFSQFSVFTYQLVNKEEEFETNMQLLRGKETIHNTSLLWTTQLDTAIRMTPCIMTNPGQKNNFVIVQDEANNLYKLDDAGNIAWKKKIPGKVISEFHAVDANKNGQQQILFNTATQLYLLDLNGGDYGNYPIRLPANATNGCEVIDFENLKNYTVFVACANRIVYAYEISGKPVTGWLFNQPVDDVVNPVQHYTSEGKDFLFIYNHHGNVFMLDKKGAVRASLTKFFIAPNSIFTFIPADSLNKDHLVTTDTTGKILNLFFNGTVKTTSIGNQPGSHLFLSTDVDGDGITDYAYLNKNQLKIFRQDSALMFSYAFNENEFSQFQSFSYTPSQHLLAAGSYIENKLYILDGKGKLSNGFPVKGCMATLTNEWGADGKKILVTSGNDGNVNAYIIN